MLNKTTMEVLNQLGQINQSQIITYPITTIILGKAIQAFFDLSKVGEEEFDEIGVFDINQLSSVLAVIDDATITNNNGTLTIKNDDQSIKYGTTDINIIESECRGKPDLLKRIVEDNEKVMSFTLNAKELDKIKKMSGLLKELSNLVISSVDGQTSLVVKSKEKSSNNYTMQTEGTAKEDISMILVMDVVKKLPNSSYEVSIHKSKKGSLVAVFKSTNVDGLSLILSAKAD